MFGTCIQQLQDFEFVNVGAKTTAFLPPRESIADSNDSKRSGQKTILVTVGYCR